MRTESFRRACVTLMSVSLVSLGMQVPAAANVVGTSEAISASRTTDARAVVDATLARADVRAKPSKAGSPRSLKTRSRRSRTRSRVRPPAAMRSP